MRTQTPLTLGDVIEVPPLRLVIQLADVDAPSSAAAREVLETFVVTRDIERPLRAIVDAFGQPTGVGAFIKGHYGSGKSHFLGYLSMLLHHEPAIRAAAALRLPPDLPPPGRVPMQIRVALQEYSGHVPLEDIVVDAAERALEQRWGQREVLSDARFLLDNFNTLLLERHPEFLAENGLTADDWRRQAAQNAPEAARVVAAFLDTLPNNPLRARADRGRSFARLFEILARHDVDGVVILLDELSEFLKARPNARTFNDDLRWLQFLGELAERQPLWIVATMQEAIEDIGYEDQELYLRIKDRYRLRFSLSSGHVEELVDGRLVRKKPSAPPAIDAAFGRLRDAFPDLDVDADRFRRIYPVHPATLSMLENLMGLFSQHRGVVDFVHARLAGDAARGIEPFLLQPADRLLSCETIFDHFYDRMREMPETAAYVNVAYAYLAADIPRLFEKARDRDIALRCVKIMILAELSPLERPRTARQLANLMAVRISAIDAQTNYLHVKENILDRLVEDSSYVRRTPADDPLDTVYGIDLQANASQIVEARTRGLMRGLDVGASLWFRILSTVNVPTLPLKELCGVGAVQRWLYWQRSARQGDVLAGDVRDLTVDDFANLMKGLETTERDWLLLIATPHEADQQEAVAHRLFEHAAASRFAPLAAVWLPRPPSDAELEACLRVVAQRQLLDQVGREGTAGEPLCDILESTLPAGMARVREIVLDAYFGGTLVFADGRRRGADDAGRFAFDRMLTELFTPSFDKVYDLHARIKPLNDDHRQESLEEMWEKAIVPGRIARAEASRTSLDRVLDGVGLQLGLFRRTAAEYVLTAEPGGHALLAEIVRSIVPGQTVSLQRLYLKFRKGRWGLPRPMFALACSTLVRVGHCSAWRDGRAVAVDSFKKMFTGGVDALGEGRILEVADRERLRRLTFLNIPSPSEAFSLAEQRTIWTAVTASLATLRTQARALEAALRNCAGYQSVSLLPVDAIRESLHRVEALAGAVDPSLDSRDGLEFVLAALEGSTPLNGDSIESDVERVRLWHQFFAQHLDAFLSMFGALRARPSRLDADTQAALEPILQAVSTVAERIEQETWDALRDEWLSFRAAYAQRYAAAHEALSTDPRLDAWREAASAPEVRLLDRLGSVYGLTVDDDAVAVRRRLSAAPRVCRLAVREALRVDWTCRCGFVPEEAAAEVPDPGPVLDAARRGLRAYADLIAAPENRERLEAHAAALRSVGRTEEAVRLARLLTAPLETSPGQVLEWLSEGALEEVNRALRGRVLVVDRRLEDLVEMLGDRVLSPAAVRQAVERWLQGVDRDAFVRVVGEARDEDDDGALLHRAELEQEAQVLAGEDAVAFIADERRHADLAQAVAHRVLKEVVDESTPLEVLTRWRDRLRSGPAAAQGYVRVCADVLDLLALLTEPPIPLDPLTEYVERVHALPLALDRLQHRQFEGADLPQYLVDDLARRVSAVIEGHGLRFEAAVHGRTLRDVHSHTVAPLLERFGACVMIIVDAMRWDVWRGFYPRVAEALPSHRIATVEPVLAVMPTRTAENRAALLEALDAERVTSADRAGRREHVARALASRGLSVVHFLFVDERLHESELPLHALMDELTIELETLLLPHLKHVAPDVPVVVVADHGFVYAPGGMPTYRHGGGSAFERVVPCAVWEPREG